MRTNQDHTGACRVVTGEGRWGSSYALSLVLGDLLRLFSLCPDPMELERAMLQLRQPHTVDTVQVAELSSCRHGSGPSRDMCGVNDSNTVQVLSS